MALIPLLFALGASASVQQATTMCTNGTYHPDLEDACDCILASKFQWYDPFTTAERTALDSG